MILVIFRVVQLSLLILEHFQHSKKIVLAVTSHSNSLPFPEPLPTLMYFLFLWIGLFSIFHTNGIIFNTWSFVIHIFHLTCFQDSSILWYMPVLWSFVRSINIPHFVYSFRDVEYEMLYDNFCLCMVLSSSREMFFLFSFPFLFLLLIKDMSTLIYPETGQSRIIPPRVFWKCVCMSQKLRMPLVHSQI